MKKLILVLVVLMICMTTSAFAFDLQKGVDYNLAWTGDLSLGTYVNGQWAGDIQMNVSKLDNSATMLIHTLCVAPTAHLYTGSYTAKYMDLAIGNMDAAYLVNKYALMTSGSGAGIYNAALQVAVWNLLNPGFLTPTTEISDQYNIFINDASSNGTTFKVNGFNDGGSNVNSQGLATVPEPASIAVVLAFVPSLIAGLRKKRHS